MGGGLACLVSAEVCLICEIPVVRLQRQEQRRPPSGLFFSSLILVLGLSQWIYDIGINYKTADVTAEVLKLTGGKGADLVLNDVGISSIPEDLKAVRQQRSVALVGFL